MNYKDLDERQKLIRAEAFVHGFCMLSLLLVVNTALYDITKFQWAEGMWSGFLLMLITLIAVIAECVFKDAHINIKNPKRYIILMAILGGGLIVAGVLGLVFPSEALYSGSMLTARGGIQVTLALVAILDLVVALGLYRSYKRDKE